jgi:hypothetical protein
MSSRRLYLAAIGGVVMAAGVVAACATSSVVTDLDASTTDPDTGTTVKDSGGTDGGKTDAGCNVGETKCGSVCKNLTNDPQNCGTCGSPCSSGRVCESSECHIACSPQTRCLVGDAGPDSGVETCVDTKTNTAHCGACNAACPSAQYCDAGACDLSCDAGTKCSVPDAGLTCVDTTSSMSHCGACNQPCTGGKVCIASACVLAPTAVQIFPPTGSLLDPGDPTYWGARYYTMTFAQQQTITGIDVRATLSSADSIRAGIWDPGTQVKLATGSTVNGSNVQAYYKSTLSFTLLANKAYIIGVFFSNANTVFPRKNSPSYPFNVAGPFGNIAVSACWSTSTANTDIFPTSTNSWGPDFRLYLQ